MNELFMTPISRVGFLVAWLYIETVYLAISIIITGLPLVLSLPSIVVTGLYYFFYALKFLLIIGIFVRRLKTAHLPEILSWLLIFPPLQKIACFMAVVYPGKYEKIMPDFKKEIKSIKLETLVFGGYGL